MPVDGVVQSATVTVDGAQLSSELYAKLSEVRVDDSLNAAGRFELRFVSEDPLPSTLVVGAEVEIAFDDDNGDPKPLMTGVVDSLAVDHDRNRRQLVVAGYDARRKLSSAPVVRAFAKQSYSDILGTIASESGLTTQIDSNLANPKFEHLMQTTSNIRFVADVCRRLGLVWRVSDKKLIVEPPTAGSAVALRFGDDLESFTARYSVTDHPSEVQVRGWNSKDKSAIVASTPAAAAVGQIGIETVSRSKAPSNRRATSWATTLTSQLHGTAIADGHSRRAVGGELAGRGQTAGNPAIVPGASCQIAGIDENWNGTYLVTAAEHVFQNGGRYVTRFAVGGYEPVSLGDLVGTRATGSPVGFGAGVTIGIVTNRRNDTDADEGLVKVKFPYLADDVESTWARVATIGAGNQRGIMFMPEVNDEVLVAFEHGDVNRPYVIGSVWNGKDAPPLQHRSDGEDATKKRQIKSKVGHTLTFFDGDSPDKKSVAIELADGATKVFVGQEKIEIIANSGKPVEVKNDKARVVLTANGDVQIEGENVSITAKRKLALEGGEVEVKSQAGAKVTAGATLDLKSSAPATLESSAILNLKGAIVKVN